MFASERFTASYAKAHADVTIRVVGGMNGDVRLQMLDDSGAHFLVRMSTKEARVLIDSMTRMVTMMENFRG